MAHFTVVTFRYFGGKTCNPTVSKIHDFNKWYCLKKSINKIYQFY